MANYLYVWDSDTNSWKNTGVMQGAKGEQGNAGTLTVGNVSQGEVASVTNVGTSDNAIFDFVLPQGEKGEKGNDGDSATVSIGTVTEGETISVTNVGTPYNAVLNFVLKRGEKGEQGNPTIVNGKSSASIEIDTRDILMTGYVKEAEGEILPSDALNVAISKLENKKPFIKYVIKVFVPDEFLGKTITCVNGEESYSKVAESITEFECDADGTWTITCDEEEETVNVSYYGVYTVEIVGYVDGKTVLPTDDIRTWLKCAKIHKPYLTIGEVINDSVTLLDLISNENACDYMARSKSWASPITIDSTSMTLIGNNDYCAETLLTDETWGLAIANSQYYDSVLTVTNPNMTSNTTPYGKASASSILSTQYDAWAAFDGNSGTRWTTDTNQIDAWVKYEFPEPVLAKKIVIGNGAYKHNSVIQASNDVSNDASKWVSLTETLNLDGYEQRTISLSNTTKYKYYRVYRWSTGGTVFDWTDLKIYGR